jgi:hypothetical protein
MHIRGFMSVKVRGQCSLAEFDCETNLDQKREPAAANTAMDVVNAEVWSHHFHQTLRTVIRRMGMDPSSCQVSAYHHLKLTTRIWAPYWRQRRC